MKKMIVAGVLAWVFAAGVVSAETYRVTVKRIEQNVYLETTSKTVIETKYCYEYAYGEDAVLKWEGRYGDNWIVFTSSGTKCDVVAIH